MHDHSDTDETNCNIIVLNTNHSKIGYLVYIHSVRTLTIFKEDGLKDNSISYIRTIIQKYKISICMIQPTMEKKDFNSLNEMGVKIQYGISNKKYKSLVKDIYRIIDTSFYSSLKVLPQLLFYLTKNFEVFDGISFDRFIYKKSQEGGCIGSIKDILLYINCNQNILKFNLETAISLSLFENIQHPNEYIQTRQDKGLFNYLNYTKTKMGREKLKENILSPTTDLREIYDRHYCIEFIDKRKIDLNTVLDNLRKIESINFSNFVNPSKKTFQDIELLLVNFLYLQSECENLIDLPKYFNNPLTSDENEKIFLFYNLLETYFDFEEDFFIIKKGVNIELDLLRNKYENIEEKMTFEAKKLSKKYSFTLKVAYFPQIGYLLESKKRIEELEEIKSDLKCFSKIENTGFRFDMNFKFDERFYYKNINCINLDKEGDIQTEIHLLEDKIMKELIKIIEKEIIIKIRNYFAEIDFLNSLCLVKNKNKLIKPTFSDKIEIEEGFVFLEKNWYKNKFNVKIEGPTFITGKNCSGKSTLLKIIGIMQIMAQIGSFIPFKVNTRIFTHIFCKMKSKESLKSEISSYFSEILQIKEMIDFKTENGLFLVDEFGKSTNKKEAKKVLEFLLSEFEEKKYFFLNVTNFQRDLKIPSNYALLQCIGNPKYQFIKNPIKEGIYKQSCALDLIKRMEFEENYIKEFIEMQDKEIEETEEVKKQRRENIKEINKRFLN